jgi:hypothetical protein
MFAEEALVGLKKQKAVRNRMNDISEITAVILTSDFCGNLYIIYTCQIPISHIILPTRR